MKLFWREQMPLIGFTAVILLLVLLVYRYDGYTDVLTSLYAVFLGICVLGAYLAYRYFSHRELYRRLSKPPGSLGSSVQKSDAAPLSAALGRLLETQYSHYQSEIKAWERTQRDHLTFINQWVHQMKTPLSVIELITEEDNDPRFASIAEETDRIRRGLEMVLYMARMQTFEQDFYVESVALRELASEAIHDYKRFFIHSHVYPVIVMEQELEVETDSKWLRFILQQLLSNAIKYSAGSGKKVEIVTFKEDNAVVLEVRDSGIGIPPEDIPRVFRPFFTGENGRRFKESTGMGLYLVQQVAAKLHLTVGIRSRVGEGTTVRLTFESSRAVKTSG